MKADQIPTSRRSDRTRAAILNAARRRFADRGFERTTIRAIAADADIDPSLVMRYYGSKAQLFDAALDIALSLPDLSSIPADRLAEELVQCFLHHWDSVGSDDALLLLLRSAVTNDRAAQRMQEIFAAEIAPALGRSNAARAGLVSAQLLGLALTRHLLRIPVVVDMNQEEIVAAYAPAIRATLGNLRSTS